MMMTRGKNKLFFKDSQKKLNESEAHRSEDRQERKCCIDNLIEK